VFPKNGSLFSNRRIIVFSKDLCPVEFVNVAGRYLLSFRVYSKVFDFAMKAFLMLIIQKTV